MSLFWKPGSAPSTNSTLLLDNDGNDTNIPLIDNSSHHHHQQQQSKDDLPIAKHRRQILYAMEKYKVIVIVGETGSGKSTQIPQYLLSSGWASPPFRVMITQPRRIAAITLASHVSSCLSTPTSSSSSSPICSHLVRFSSTVDSTTTRLIFATDGMVVREALVDPLLSRYSVVIVDEAHERGLNSDVLLGLLKKIRRKRNDLRVVICSASIDAKAFLDYFCKTSQTTEGGGGATTKRKRRRLWSNVAPRENDDDNSNDDGIGTIISIDGRQHPVDILYSENPVSDYITATVDTCLRIHYDDSSGDGDDDGDILCFLPSGEDIDRAIRLTDDKLRSRRSDRSRPPPSFPSLLPLYGSLPYHLQTRIFAPQQRSSSHRRRRRIIFATNMAETSVTVPHIKYVIDCGLVKLPYFDPSNGFERLVTAPISRASAIQRAGRAGRVRPGKCFRLYTEEGMRRDMVAATPPEMMRANLTGFVLTLAALGVDDLRGFDLMGEPSEEGVRHALEVLYALGAIDDGDEEEGGRCRLTSLGLKMCEFSCDPRVAKMLLYSMEVGCAEDVLTVAAVLQVRDLMVRPKGDQQMLDFEECLSDVVDAAGDHVTYLNIMERDWDKGERECRDVFVNYLAVKRAKEVRAQLRRFLRRYGHIKRNDGVGDEERGKRVRKCVTAGFFFNVAKLESDGRYYTLKGKHVVKITPMSVLKRYGESKEYMVFGETFDGSKGGLEVRHCSLIEGKWLRELAPHYWA